MSTANTKKKPVKIHLTKKQAKVVTACLEELLTADWWSSEYVNTRFAGLSYEGDKEIREILGILLNKYNVDSDDIYESLFVDMRMKKS